MGCHRDQIDPESFALNIVDSQQSTGATVCIILYDQPSNKR